MFWKYFDSKFEVNLNILQAVCLTNCENNFKKLKTNFFSKIDLPPSKLNENNLFSFLGAGI